jgi:hypothetical protein
LNINAFNLQSFTIKQVAINLFAVGDHTTQCFDDEWKRHLSPPAGWSTPLEWPFHTLDNKSRSMQPWQHGIVVVLLAIFCRVATALCRGRDGI